MALKFSRKPVIGIPRCVTNLHFASFLLLLLVVLLHEDGTMGRSDICSGFCEFDSQSSSSRCSDGRSCIERVHHETEVLEIFADADEGCYRETNPVFPVYIDNISTSVHNTILSVNILWKWPSLSYVKKTEDYKTIWGVQYIITVPGENRTNCNSVSLSEEHIQRGMLNIPCMKFRDDGFPALEFKITFIAYVVEKIKSRISFTPSRLQEVTISKAGKPTNSLLSVWNSQMKYHIANYVLTVNFTPALPVLNYISYEVRVFKALESKCLPSSSYVDKIDVVPTWPTTSVNFNITNYEVCAKYCVSVHPVRKSTENNCSEGCVKEMHDMILFHVPPRILECINWDGNFVVQMHPFQNAVTTSFNVCCGYDFCFEKFVMMLFKPSKSICTLPGWLIDKKVFYRNTSGNVITFEDVAPGNYCVRVSPVHNACQRNINICSVRYTFVYELVEPYARPLDMLVPESPVVNEVMLISILSVIGIIIFVTIVGILWQKTRPPPKVEINMTDTHRGDGELLDAGHSNAPKEVVFLYTHDERTSNRVKALSNFLEHSGNFKVILDVNHLAKITAEHSCFISETLQYNCPENGVHSCFNDNRRIIIVESKRAVKLLRKKEDIMRAAMQLHPIKHKNCDMCKLAYECNETYNENDGNLSSDDEEKLPNMCEKLDKLFFCLGISFITSTRRRFIDDCHIFVVQFSDSPLPGRETFMYQFPGKRYCLPRQLGDLCLNLNRIDQPRDFMRFTKINEMHEQWENDKFYKELVEMCNRQK